MNKRYPVGPVFFVPVFVNICVIKLTASTITFSKSREFFSNKLKPTEEKRKHFKKLFGFLEQERFLEDMQPLSFEVSTQSKYQYPLGNCNTTTMKSLCFFYIKRF